MSVKRNELAGGKGGMNVLTKEELGTLIMKSERQLYATAKTILKNDQDCADAIQEMIVKVFMKVDHLKEERYAKTWMIRILINECYNILRKNSKVISIDSCKEIEEMHAPEKKNYESLYQAVGHLKKELRIPVVLYYAEDFSIREIAQILNVSEGAIQKRLARARAKLKNEIEILEEAK